MKRTLILAVAAIALAASGRAYAHHSFVKVEAPDDKGQMQTWSVEWGGGAQLTQAHVTRDTLKYGDHVIVTGNPGRDPSEHRIRLHKIVRPSDGWKWEGVIM